MKKLSVLILVLLSAIIFTSFSASAGNINLGDNIEISYSKKTQEHSFSFTAPETAWYELSIDTPLPKDTYVSTYNSAGKEIGFDYWDGTTSKCLSAVELSANQTYSFVITCETKENVILAVKMNKHAHQYQVINTKKADQYSEGYEEKECTVCEHHEKFPIGKLNISVSATEFIYNGKAQVPSVSVSNANGKALINGTDYTVTHLHSGADAGSDYSLKVVVSNSLYDAFEIVNYKISPKDISALTIKISDTTVPYGKQPTIKISGLTQGKDFDCNAPYDEIGKQKAVVYGKGNYCGAKTLSYTVIPCTVSGLKVEKATASSLKLSWKEDKSDETEYYQIYDVKTKKTVTIDDDKLSYTVKNLKAGTSYSFKVRGYAEEDGNKYYGDWTVIKGITKPTATALKSLKSEKAKTFIAKWTAKSGVTGYQIQYSTAADFSSPKTVKIADDDAVSKTVTSLKSGKKYYVRVRTYKTLKVDGKSKTVYSDWSKALSVKVK